MVANRCRCQTICPPFLRASTTSARSHPFCFPVFYNQPVRHLFQTYSLSAECTLLHNYASRSARNDASPLPLSPPLPAISSSRRFASLLDSLDEIAMGFALSSIRGKRPYTRPSLQRSRFNGDYNNPGDSWRGGREDLSRENLLLVYY